MSYRDLKSLGVIIFIILAFLYLVFNLYKKTCVKYGEVTNRQVKYNGECFVKYRDNWYSRDEYKFIEINKKD